MPLKEIVIFRVNGEFKKLLEDQARKMGVSSSALIRNTVAIALVPDPEPNMLQQVMANYKREKETELYAR
jgi:hypothetical protein